MFDVLTKPNDLKVGIDMNKYMYCYITEKYKDRIYDGKHIIAINEVSVISIPKIMTNGRVRFKIKSKCTVIDLEVGDVVSMEVSSTNKMGATYKNNCITIFIPKHKCINEIIPQEGEQVNVEILGKRVDERIVYVGKIK